MLNYQNSRKKVDADGIFITPINASDERSIKKLMFSLGVSRQGANILLPKSMHLVFRVEGIRSWEANIIKQHLLSLGSDAAIERNALLKDIKTDILIFGNLSQLSKLCEKLKPQPFNLKKISEKLSFYVRNIKKRRFTIKARDKTINIKKPIICGIINVTLDSFSGDGLLKDSNFPKSFAKLALKKTAYMVKNGAKIIDIGGESSRPFSHPISEQEEIKRVIPVLRVLRKEFKKTIFSIDTYKYQVLKHAIDEGVDIVNDITALRAQPKIAGLIKKNKLGCVLMHMKGTPVNMQVNPKYDDIIKEELNFFEERLNFCNKKGIIPEQVLIDPGIGFGKRLEDNIKIINELHKFKVFGLPIFLGLSRKSFIGKILNVGVNQRLCGTIASCSVALQKGASVLRVHDVREIQQALKVTSKIMESC